jgi:hypothetical protein
MERKVFKLPMHPVTKEIKQIVIEKPAPESVWYLVLDKNKAIPLVNLKDNPTAKDVMDAAAKQQGEGWMFWFVSQGYSRLKKVM